MNTPIIDLFVIPLAVGGAALVVTVFLGSVIITAVAEYEAARNRKARREAARRANSL